MKFRIWLEHGESHDYQSKTWFHGTLNLIPLVQSKRLKTREDGVKARNAAAMGIGIYLTDDLDEAKAYVPTNVAGGVVSVRIIKPVKLLRLYNTPEDTKIFEQIRSAGLNDPKKATQIVAGMGFNGVHWDMLDNTQKVVVYDPNVLSDVTTVARSITTPGTLDRSWG